MEVNGEDPVFNRHTEKNSGLSLQRCECDLIQNVYAFLFNVSVVLRMPRAALHCAVVVMQISARMSFT